MRAFVASLMVVVLGVVQTGLAGLCFCHEGELAEAASEGSEEAHTCCATPPEPGADAAELFAACGMGCCEAPAFDEVRERVSQADPLPVPGERLDQATAPGARAALLGQRLAVASPHVRGPPPPPLTVRLARLQSWLC